MTSFWKTFSELNVTLNKNIELYHFMESYNVDNFLLNADKKKGRRYD